jgi:hypothetical protein
MPYQNLEVIRAVSFIESRLTNDPDFRSHIEHQLANELARKMAEDGYIHIERRPHKMDGDVLIATIGVVPKEKVLPVVKQMEQYESKLSCMCGEDVGHHNSYHGGHSPVSMYDHALDRAQSDLKVANARVAQLEARLEQVFP